MGTPTRFLNGVQVEAPGHPLQNWRLPNPAYDYHYFDDFTNYTAGHWYAQQVGAGSTVSVMPFEGSAALGTSGQFAILAAAGVTNVGASVVTGSVGSYPVASIVGFPPGTLTGRLQQANPIATQAVLDATTTYNAMAALTVTSTIATDLGGQSLTAGVFDSAAGDFSLAGSGDATLTLTGNATDQFVFKTATTLTTGAGGVPTITLAGGALAQNVFWIVGSSATLNSGFAGTFEGTVLAYVSVTNTLGGVLNGTVAALTGAVTFSAATTANATLGSSFSASGSVVGGWLGLVAGASGFVSLQGAHPATSFGVAPVGGNSGQTWFDTAIMLDAEVTNPDYLIGMTAGNVTSLTTPTDGVYFTKATGAVVWSINIKSSVTGNVSTFELPELTLPQDSTTIGLAWYYDGRASPALFVYWNGNCVGRIGFAGTIGEGTVADLINLPSKDVLLAPTFLNVMHTAPSTLGIDHVLTSTEITRYT